MKTITKKEFCKIISDSTSKTQTDTGNIVQEVLDGIAYELSQGNRIEFRDFGIFEVRERKARNGRNPKTGEAITIPAHKKIVFKVGKALKDRITAADLGVPFI